MAPPAQTYRFGSFRLDPAAYRLLKADAPLALSPKALDLLLLFVTRPALLLTKDDILQALWPDVAVTDNAITQVVSELRQALEDSAASPRFVETVPRRGYRFVAAVEVDDDASRLPQAPVKRPAESPRTIAVQDFTNVTGDEEVGWLGAGIAETVTNDLQAIRDLRVIDRVLMADATRRAPEHAARTMGLDLIVIGSFQRAGDRLRITARAVDVTTQETLAHAKADGALADVFPLQDAIVTQLSAGLQVTVTPAAAARISVRETSSLDAYRALTEGRLKLETLDPAEIAGAVANFERALALDPRYALAEVGLGHARFWRFQASRARNRPDVAELSAAVAHAMQAIALDQNLAEAHSALALFLAGAGRTAEAVAAGRLAVALEPGNWRHQFRLGAAAWGSERLTCLETVVSIYPPLAYAYWLMAMVHVARADLTRAADMLTRGLAFARPVGAPVRFPGQGLHWLLGLTRLAGGDIVEARAEFDRELASGGRGIFADEFAMDAYDGHGFALLQTGDAAGAAVMFAKALERFPDHARSLLGKAQACRQLGQRKNAETALAHARRAIDELREHGRAAEAMMATAFASVVADRPSEAIATLDHLLTGAPPGTAGWTIPVEPFLAPLASQPLFQAVLGRLAARAAS